MPLANASVTRAGRGLFVQNLSVQMPAVAMVNVKKVEGVPVTRILEAKIAVYGCAHMTAEVTENA